jgi:hypothetical protein
LIRYVIIDSPRARGGACTIMRHLHLRRPLEDQQLFVVPDVFSSILEPSILCRHLHGTTCSFNFFFRVKRNFIDNEFVIKICICSCYLFVELVKAIHQFLFRFTFRF